MTYFLQTLGQVVVPCSSEVKRFVNGFYTHAASQCAGLDVRILLSNISNTSDIQLKQHVLNRAYHVSLLDCAVDQDVNVILDYIKQNFPQESSEISTIRILQESSQDVNETKNQDADEGEYTSSSDFNLIA